MQKRIATPTTAITDTDTVKLGGLARSHKPVVRPSKKVGDKGQVTLGGLVRNLTK